MKKFIINNVMNYIKKNTDYNTAKLKEMEYGLISIYLTLSKIIIILILAFILGIFKEVTIFMIYFSILRTTGYGIHATKSWICLLSSTLIFIVTPIFSKWIHINLYIKLILGFIGIILILKNTPADTKNKPIINKKRRRILKIITTIFSILYCIIAIIVKDNFMSNCLIFAIITEAILVSPITYKIFKLPYNNYITFLNEHPDFLK